MSRFPVISPPKQSQEEPGLDAELIPQTDRGEQSYRGTGRLEGRRALITGSDSGIGAAVAIAFAREGADVAISYLPEEQTDAEHVAQVIEGSGRRAFLIPGDISDPEFCTQLVDEAASRLGGLDALVNNAGRQIAIESFENLTDEQVQHTFDVNILAQFRIVRAALRHLPEGSTIVNTTSIQAYKPSTHLLDYASTKAAINNFSKGLAQQLAPRGIRVNAVAPGPIWTPLQVSQGQPKDALPEFGKHVPLGRAGQPTELAPAYVFLTSPESSYVIGETLNVNGGTPSP
ncbi:SDR family oxidoreductase [Ancrocorticia populi]|uniref:SDR family oxidoreductase n=1 Tax=Ancrocorticia populi TaxID=2175228 RepID=UPI003F8F149A